MTITTPGLHLNVLLPEADGMSAEEFYHFCQANPEGNFEREADGTILIMAPVNFESGRHESDAITELNNWNRKTKAGYVFSSNAGFTLPNGAIRSPDAAWIVKHRADALPQSEHEKFAAICPDFVIEIRSKTDRVATLQKKMDEYLRNGCRLGFLIDPVSRKAWVYEPGNEPLEVPDFSGFLYGGELLPGFMLELALFL